MRAFARLITILEVIGARPASTVTDVASATGLSVATVSRLTRELATLGLLERGDKGYRLGRRLLALAQRGNDPSALVDVALPIMQDLRDASGETVSLHVRVGNDRTCVAEVQSYHQVRRVVPPGFTVPLHLGATGEVLLAGQSEAERAAYVDALGLPDSERGELLARVAEIAEAGWAMKESSFEEGLAGVATGIRRDGVVIASMSVAGPSWRLTRIEMLSLVQALVDAAELIGDGIAASERIAGAV